MKSLVDLYLSNLPDPWPRQIGDAVVGMMRESCTLKEDIKWGHPYFSLDGRAIVKFYVAHEWINIYFYQGAELSDPTRLLGPEGRSRMRRLQLFREQAIPSGLRDLIRESIVYAQQVGKPSDD